LAPYPWASTTVAPPPPTSRTFAYHRILLFAACLLGSHHAINKISSLALDRSTRARR
jgi:hypothetical protein